jgi:ribonuclease E
MPSTPATIEASVAQQQVPVVEAHISSAQPQIIEQAPVSTPVAEPAPLEPIVTAEVVIEVPKAVESVMASSPVEPPAPVVATPVIDIGKALEESGLVMVETSNDKAQFIQPAVTSSEETPRPRRKRPAPVVVSDEPLMMVETQK